MNTEGAITENLVYLAENITNLTKILLYLLQEKIISQNEKEEIESKTTDLDKNSKLLSLLQKKDLALKKFIEILRLTNNNNCAKKLEESTTISLEIEILEGNKSKKLRPVSPRKISKATTLRASKRLKNDKGLQQILKTTWWPEKKLLVKSLYKRKFGDKLLVEKLHEIISTNENRRVVICESEAASKLTGLGGVGKTLTANWYAHEYEKEYQHVIWIDCGEGNLLTSFKKLVRDLDVKHLDKLIDLDDCSRKSYDVLEDFKCLWVFDNAENYRGDEGIKNVLPKERNNFYCLITSRSMDWGTENIGYGNIPLFELNIFEGMESVEFFKENLIPEIEFTDYQLKQLCVLLGNLPLAMQLAATALNKGKINLQDYIEKTSAKDLENIIDAKFDDYERTINGSFQITLELIAKEEFGNLAKEILNIFGYIRPDEVDALFLINIFNYSSNVNSELINSEIFKAIELLTTYSLITSTTPDNIEVDETEIDSLKWADRESKTILGIHRLLQQVIRHNGRKTEKETLRKILRCRGFLEYKLIPFSKYADDDLQKEFPKVKAELIDQRQLQKLLKENRFEESVQLAKFIDEEMRTNTTKFNYAICLEKNGQFSEGKKLMEELSREEIEERNEYYLLTLGVLELIEKVTKELVYGHLLVLEWRLGNRKVQEMLDNRKRFAILESQDSLNVLLEIFDSNLINCNYSLECLPSVIHFQSDGSNKRIDFGDYALDISKFPPSVEELLLRDVKVAVNGGINLPNLKKLQLKDMSSSCLPLFSSVQVAEIQLLSDFAVQDFPLDLSDLPPTVQKLYLTKMKVFLSREINLPNLKYLNLRFMSFSCLPLFSSVQLNQIEIFSEESLLDFSLDLSDLPPSVQKLSLRNVDVFVRGGIDLPNLKYLRLKDMNSSYLVLFRSVELKEIEIEHYDFSVDGRQLVDLSDLPPGVQKLSLTKMKAFKSGGIDLPNLKYLALHFTSSSFLSLFSLLHLTYIDVRFSWVEKLNLDILPKSLRNFKISVNYSSVENTEITSTGEVRPLDKLVLDYFTMVGVDQMLNIFHPTQLVILHKETEQLSASAFIELVKKQIRTIAVGRVEFGTEYLDNFNLSKHVDRNANYYLLERETGKVMEKKDFEKLCELFGMTTFKTL